MEFYADAGDIRFLGYSLFTAENGAYVGNLLAPDYEIEKRLAEYIPVETIAEVKESLCNIMRTLMAGSGYCGYFGIDMMLYDNGDGCRLNPCMEVNLRTNMGVVSRLFYDRFVHGDSRGIYRVRFFKQPGEAWDFHREMQTVHPLKVENGRVLEGYMTLAPVTPDNRYVAYVIIGNDIC